VPDDDFDQIRLEHEALMLTYMEVQTRCTAQMQSLAREVETLKRQLVQLRAKVIVRDSALAWEREQRHALAQAMALDLLLDRFADPGALEPLGRPTFVQESLR
jgi:hypothetical protein